MTTAGTTVEKGWAVRAFVASESDLHDLPGGLAEVSGSRHDGDVRGCDMRRIRRRGSIDSYKWKAEVDLQSLEENNMSGKRGGSTDALALHLLPSVPSS